MSRDRAAPPLSAADPSYAALKALVVNATGLAYYNDKDHLFLERVQRRLSLRGLDSCADYLSLISSDRGERGEFDGLVADLTIGETCFFRYPEQFAVLRDHVLPDCIERNGTSRRLRIWSAGCATGAEPFSIAILVEEVLGHRIADWQVTILGTDINRPFLERAQQGLFADWSVRNVPDQRRPTYFSRAGRHWRIKDHFRRHVSLLAHNLVQDAFPPPASGAFGFDIIFCRNVMIYFDQETNRRLVDRLDDSLQAGGWLFLGPAEVSFYQNERLAPESFHGTAVYRKRAADPNSAGRPAALPKWPDHSPTAGRSPDLLTVVAPPLFPVPDMGIGNLPRPAHEENPAAQDAAATNPQGRPLAEVIALANRGAWPSAAQCCRSLLRADPFNVGAHFYLAIVLQSMGDVAAAEDALRRAVYLDRDLAVAHYHLGLLRKNAGDLATSERYWRNAQRILASLDDASIVSFCGRITAAELRELTKLQLGLLKRS